MVWTIKLDSDLEKDLKRLDRSVSKRIFKFLRERVAKANNPRELGQPLSAGLSDFWRYRVGDYRVLVKIEDKTLTVLVVRVAHRKHIYKKQIR